MSGELFTEQAYPNGLRCMGCGHDFMEGELICERPGDHPGLEAVGRMVTGQPVVVMELVCRECAP